jgi:hypothetical protein
MFSSNAFRFVLVLAAACNAVTSAEDRVLLGTAGDFVILSKAGISTVPDSSVITGDIGVSPAAATYMTGFSLIADSTGLFSTSTQVVGEAYASDYISPTPSKMTTAVSDMETAYTDAAGRPNANNTRINLNGGLINGETLTPGVYTFTSDISFTSDITFDGGADDIFIIQTSKNVIAGSGAAVILSGGAKPENIFWQVAGFVDVGTTAHLEGVFLVATQAVFKTGSSLNGRVLTQTACTLDRATINEPALLLI